MAKSFLFAQAAKMYPNLLSASIIRIVPSLWPIELIIDIWALKLKSGHIMVGLHMPLSHTVQRSWVKMKLHSY